MAEQSGAGLCPRTTWAREPATPVQAGLVELMLGPEDPEGREIWCGGSTGLHFNLLLTTSLRAWCRSLSVKRPVSSRSYSVNMSRQDLSEHARSHLLTPTPLLPNAATVSRFAKPSPATRSGGAISSVSYPLTLLNNTFIGNAADPPVAGTDDSKGGAVYASSVSWVKSVSNTFSDNWISTPKARGGGAIYVEKSTAKNVTMYSGVSVDTAALTPSEPGWLVELDATTFNNNSATNGGAFTVKDSEGGVLVS